MNNENVLTCVECNPPSINDAQNDYWQCSKCHQKFRLDREQRTWWPESIWDKRYDKPQIFEHERGQQ